MSCADMRVCPEHKWSWLRARQLPFMSGLAYTQASLPPSWLEKKWGGGARTNKGKFRGGRVKGWNDKKPELGGGSNYQRWARGFREVMICLAACAHPPPCWHNRTMYSRSFKYLYSTSCSCSHTCLDTFGRTGGSRSETVFDYINFLPSFFSPSVSVHICTWVVQVFQCSVAEFLIKMAESRTFVWTPALHSLDYALKPPWQSSGFYVKAQ